METWPSHTGPTWIEVQAARELRSLTPNAGRRPVAGHWGIEHCPSEPAEDEGKREGDRERVCGVGEKDGKHAVNIIIIQMKSVVTAE